MKTLLVASIKTLKRPKIICLIDEIIKLVEDSLEESITREGVHKTLQFLIDNDSVNLTLFRIGYVSPCQKIILVEA